MKRQSSDVVTIPRELCGIIKRVSNEPAGVSVNEQLKVTCHDPNSKFLTRGDPDGLVGSDRGVQEVHGGRDLLASVCRPDAPDGLSARSDAHEDLTSRPSMRLGAFQAVGDGLVFGLGSAPARVMAFDIETTGLSGSDSITCVSAYDPDGGVSYCSSTPYGSRLDEFLKLLDDAPLLCAFNGVRFDIPFIARRWGVPKEQVGRWVMKLVDPFEISKLALGKTFSLNALLAANGMESKTGSGMEAVKMARQGRWAELEEYCMSDTVKTHALVKRGEWIVPVT